MKSIQKPFFIAIRFLREVKIEMKRVNWLGKKEVVGYTAVVIGISIIVGIYLGALDLFLTWVLGKII